jgi:hypothetical protein
MLRCHTAEVALERLLQDWRLHSGGSYSFGYSTLEMVKLTDVWEELPDIYIYIYIYTHTHTYIHTYTLSETECQ